ncbi:exosome complex component CSL4-like [Argonauta hians]
MLKSGICLPGQKLCQLTDEKCSGNGTYIRNGYIYSSLAGFLHSETTDDKTLVEVRSTKTENIVPSVDALVTAKITNVNPRFCKCLIINVGKVRLRESFRGMIRKEDVKATEKDKVEMYQCFRPGDNELGVVVATSEAGYPMVPISWKEMQCPHTLTKEKRKVAKVQPQYIDSPE